MRALLIAILLSSNVAHAKHVRVRRGPLVRVAQTREPSRPAPGTCISPQAGVKFCSVLPDGQGVFDVYAAWPSYLHVRFDDPIQTLIEPDPKFFQSDKRGNTVTIIPIARHLPVHNWQATITTAAVTVTLNIIPGTGRADAQITVVDPARAGRQAEDKTIEQRAQARALDLVDQSVLTAIASGKTSIASTRGKTIARNKELIVLRTTGVVRLGQKSFLTFSIENRSPEPFDLRKVRFWIGNQETAPTFHLEHTPIAPNEEVRGALALAAPAQAQICRLLLEETDGRRNVELFKLELPR